MSIIAFMRNPALVPGNAAVTPPFYTEMPV